jgi:hypothetical protein
MADCRQILSFNYAGFTKFLGHNDNFKRISQSQICAVPGSYSPRHAEKHGTSSYRYLSMVDSFVPMRPEQSPSNISCLTGG